QGDATAIDDVPTPTARLSVGTRRVNRRPFGVLPLAASAERGLRTNRTGDLLWRILRKVCRGARSRPRAAATTAMGAARGLWTSGGRAASPLPEVTTLGGAVIRSLRRRSAQR